MKKYIVADSQMNPGGGRTHIFDESGKHRERETRFVWDVGQEVLVALDVRRNRAWQRGTRHEMSDLTDSLLNANPDALDNPQRWGLVTTDDLPEWAAVPDDSPSPS